MGEEEPDVEGGVMAPKTVEAAGVVIVADGYKRSARDVASDFVLKQVLGQCGGDRLVLRLSELLAAYGDPRNAGGPLIAPLTIGGDHCLCEPLAETQCQALGCPRKAHAA